MRNISEADADGRCCRHPAIRLRHRHSRTGHWKILLVQCPLCVADAVGRRGVPDSAPPRPTRRRGDRDAVPRLDTVLERGVVAAGAGAAGAAGRVRTAPSEASQNPERRARDEESPRRPDASATGRRVPASKAAPKVLKRPKYIACETEIQRQLQKSQDRGVTYMSSDIDLAVGKEDDGNGSTPFYEDSDYGDIDETPVGFAPSVDHEEGSKIELANNCMATLHPNTIVRYVATACSDGNPASTRSFPGNSFDDCKYRVTLQPNGMILYEPTPGSDKRQRQQPHRTHAMSSILSFSSSMSSILSSSSNDVREDPLRRLSSYLPRNPQDAEAVGTHACVGVQENQVADALRRAAAAIDCITWDAGGRRRPLAADVLRRAAIAMKSPRDAGAPRRPRPPRARPGPSQDGEGREAPARLPGRGAEPRGKRAGRACRGRVPDVPGKSGVASEGAIVPRSIVPRPMRAPPRMPAAA